MLNQDKLASVYNRKMAAIHFYAADVTKTTWKKCEKSGTI